MIKTECKFCNHRAVCRYAERFLALQKEIGKILLEGEDALFEPNVMCRHHEGKQTIVKRAGEHHE